MDTQFNNRSLANLKHYLNTNFKLIGFDYKRQGDSFTTALDDILVIKIMCKECVCEKIIYFMTTFANRYELYMETQKISVNGHFYFHQFKIFLKK